MKECLNKKMILKLDTQRQEGLFVTSNVQSTYFIQNEKIIVAQEFMSDCLTYNNYKLTFRLYLMIKCCQNSIDTYTYNNGLVYYNNNIDKDIASFYGSYDLYDKNYPITIKDLEEKMEINIIDKLISSISQLATVIKKDQLEYYHNDLNYYNELFGVDFHLTNDLNAYVLEVNGGPGMTPYCARDKELRIDMLKGYIDTIHNKYNPKIILI